MHFTSKIRGYICRQEIDTYLLNHCWGKLQFSELTVTFLAKTSPPEFLWQPCALLTVFLFEKSNIDTTLKKISQQQLRFSNCFGNIFATQQLRCCLTSRLQLWNDVSNGLRFNIAFVIASTAPHITVFSVHVWCMIYYLARFWWHVASFACGWLVKIDFQTALGTLHPHCGKRLRFWLEDSVFQVFLVSIFSYSVRMRENTDLKSFKYRHFSRSAIVLLLPFLNLFTVTCNSVSDSSQH